MGGNYSTLPKFQADFPYFSLTFRQTDKIKLVLANEAVILMIRRAVERHWVKGIQIEGVCDDGSYEIKFNGNPFSITGSSNDALQSKRVCCQFLSDLYSIGWTLITSSDLSRTTDRSTLFFQRACLENVPTQVVCVSLSSSDKLQLINASKKLTEVFKRALVNGYKLGVQEELLQLESDYEVKLKGYPWQDRNTEEGVCARKLLLEIISQFEQSQFKFYGTANMKGTADCMFFKYDAATNTSNYMMISLNRNDRMRLINCPQNIMESTKNLIGQYWPHGLQGQSQLSGVVWEYKLKGYPWWADGHDAVSSRLFITLMIQNYLSIGWCLVTSLDVSRRVSDKSVFVFKSCQPTSLPHFCISLNETDKIRLINAPKDMPDLMRQLILNTWSRGIQEEKQYFESYQFKLNGSPWISYDYGNEYLQARCMMTVLLSNLMERGWRVVTSADVSAKYHHEENGPDYPLDLHSWFICYTGNTSAMPTPSTAKEYAFGPPSYSDLYGSK